MKKLALIAVVALALVVTAPAGAAKGPTLRSLQSQVTKLKKQVKTLQTQVTTARTIATVALVYSGCSTAVTADALQNSWRAQNLFGPQTPVNDYGVCSDLEIVRATNQNPPTVGVLQALLDLFRPSSLFGFLK
jgi:hypothetical protein